MPRPAEDIVEGAALHYLAVVHDDDFLGDIGDDTKIVGDQQHRHAELALQVVDQLQDLRLDGDVERGGGLVGDQEVGLVGQRHGDHDALPLAARELMRIGPEPPFGIGQPDEP